MPKTSNILIVVESPAKAKTITKYLNKLKLQNGNTGKFTVLASYGHVRDLNKGKHAIVPENNFAMNYTIIERNSKHVDKIITTAKKSDEIYLATDPDREGEAISWHILEIIKDRINIKNKPIKRIAFYEITRNAVQESFANPREICMNLVNAQQARRALDYLVGFSLSPLLWSKIMTKSDKGGVLSAGRVQSPSLRMIVERAQEIKDFKSQEYWDIASDLETLKQEKFQAKLYKYNDEKVKQFSFTNEKETNTAINKIKHDAHNYLIVHDIQKKERKRNPSAPFITSTLQQEAARKLHFSAQKTMKIAQELYEGLQINGESIGLITYMRTDSVNLSKIAMNEIREVIIDNFGKDFCPEKPRFFKKKSKNAQEAHEAIRPTSTKLLPDNVKNQMNLDHFKLYKLIWQKTIASQMNPAIINTVSIDFCCAETQKHIFRSTGSTIKYLGFMQAYETHIDQNADKENILTDNNFLPNMKIGEKIKINKILSNQHFTEPPPKYNESSLIKSLEEKGIGRPSTYASIIQTLLKRNYVVFDNKKFIPTDVGSIVNKFLVKYFAKYVDYDFTAELENELDAISRGEKEWIPVLSDFWQPFINLAQQISVDVKRSDVTREEIDESCPECGKKLSMNLGKTGFFIGCTGYPDCTFTRSMNGEKIVQEVVKDRQCPQCEHDLIIKSGRYGKFIGCSNYPQCSFMEPLNKPEDTKVACPECNKANILKRKSKKGKVFYSCANYPTCKYAIWYPPIAKKCPKCEWPILMEKTTKRSGTQIVCPNKECKYIEEKD